MFARLVFYLLEIQIENTHAQNTWLIVIGPKLFFELDSGFPQIIRQNFITASKR